ncbi:hypothetical protein COO59_09685 [Mixta theicola]|uniref:Uncharacterized protein n=1 Tax=Mixta theicola TaxID=1458355 RepID=A0A2K1Q9P9_9GAMM|nr:hypothetical protein COO59_09685 [Mixta theicola]GLR07678.1 hypothetical protein GCM10007905_03970 [Mixta theicola]
MKTETPGVSMAMRERINKVLREVEQRGQGRILYACESGSRGWGFAGLLAGTVSDAALVAYMTSGGASSAKKTTPVTIIGANFAGNR